MMITKTQVEEIFDGIIERGDWDISKPLLYGYFFADTDRSKLEKASDEPVRMGYKFVDIFIAEREEEDDEEYYFLHVEKVEVHSVDSLDKRNNDLYAFADQFNLDSYDGFDIGQA